MRSNPHHCSLPTRPSPPKSDHFSRFEVDFGNLIFLLIHADHIKNPVWVTPCSILSDNQRPPMLTCSHSNQPSRVLRLMTSCCDVPVANSLLASSPTTPHACELQNSNTVELYHRTERSVRIDVTFCKLKLYSYLTCKLLLPHLIDAWILHFIISYINIKLWNLG